MERDTLIRLGSLLFVVVFALELFALRSSIQNQSQSQQATENNTGATVYGTAETTATLASYSDYLNVFKQGRDIGSNTSIKQLGGIEGVGYFNNQSGTVTLVLDQGANVSLIASKVKGMFPDLNVTAKALFYLPSQIEFTTSLGKMNVSPNMMLAIEMEPTLDVGDNVTMSLIALIEYNSTLAETPVAKIIPTAGEASANATIVGVGDEYSAAIMFPWNMRNVNVSSIETELSANLMNLSVNYTPNSYVAVKGLDSADNDTLKKVENLSYVTDVSGGLVYVRDDFNDSKLIESDLKKIVGDNTTVDYRTSAMDLTFSSKNVSKDYLLKHTGGVLVLYRGMTLELGGKLEIAGSGYDVPANTTFNVMLLDSYSVGQNVSILLNTGTIGKRIVGLELGRIEG